MSKSTQSLGQPNQDNTSFLRVFFLARNLKQKIMETETAKQGDSRTYSCVQIIWIVHDLGVSSCSSLQSRSKFTCLKRKKQSPFYQHTDLITCLKRKKQSPFDHTLMLSQQMQVPSGTTSEKRKQNLKKHTHHSHLIILSVNLCWNLEEIIKETSIRKWRQARIQRRESYHKPVGTDRQREGGEIKRDFTE